MTRAWPLLALLAAALSACPASSPPDTTPPAVTGHAPADGATNVWVQDPITVTFSKAIRPGSVTAQSVQLAAAGSVTLARSVSFSADGKTMTVAPVSPPSVPNVLTLALDGLTDASGNALGKQSWSWTLPEWQAPPGADPAPNPSESLSPRLARAPDGTLLLAYERADGIAVERFTGGAWQALGPAWRPADLPNFYLRGLAVDPAGRPVVALLGSFNGPLAGYVARWSGSAWDALGGPIAAPPDGELDFLELALDPSGVPSVAASGPNATGGYAEAWTLNAGFWTPIGGGAAVTNAGTILGGLSVSGLPEMLLGVLDGGTWKGLLARWSGSSWDAATGPLVWPTGAGLGPMSLAVDDQGVVTAATTVPDGAGGFQGLVARPANGTWAPLGASAGPARSFGRPPLALDANGNPWVAVETPDHKAIVRRWTGNAWQDAGGAFHAATGDATVPISMVLDAGGNPWVAVAEMTGSQARAYVLRPNR